MTEHLYDTHDDLPGAQPGDVEPVNEADFERSLALRQARNRALAKDAWIADEFEFIERELVNLKRIKRPKGKQPSIWLQTPGEVLDAVKLGVVDKNEARVLLGLKKRRQPRGLRRTRQGGK